MKCRFAVVFAFLGTLKGVVSVAINGTCTTDAECVADNLNTFCRPEISSSCGDKGVCICKLDYEWDTNKCKRRRYNRDSCTDSEKCQAGTECVSGMCTCTGSYNSELHMCLDTAKKAVDEICSLVSDCYTVPGVDNSVQCVAATGSSDKKCKCLDGYLREGARCVKPRFGSFCRAGVGCSPRYPDTVTNDGSFAAETCKSSRCQCPDNHVEKRIRVGEYQGTFCVAPFTGTKVAIGQVCADTNKCSTGFCYECTDETDKKCVADTT